MPFGRGTTEERAAKEQANRDERERKERERARRAFNASPAGRARRAFENGDQLFQYELDVKNTSPVVIPMGTARTATSTNDPTAILNSVCREGWELVNGSFVFHELGMVSRDKLMSSGQQTAIRGTVIGYYLFRRCDANRVAEDTTDEQLVAAESAPAILPQWSAEEPATASG